MHSYQKISLYVIETFKNNKIIKSLVIWDTEIPWEGLATEYLFIGIFKVLLKRLKTFKNNLAILPCPWST